MSTTNNTLLLERAAELLDEIQGHPSGLDMWLEQAIESGDFQELQSRVSRIEAELAREHFNNYDLVVF